MPKITELTALTSLTSDDLTYFVDAPGTTPTGKKVAFSTLKSAVLNYSNTVVVALTGADYTSIQTAYTYAKTLSPSATNRILVKVMPGRYTEQLVMDTNYIDLAGEGICTAEIYSNITGYTVTKSCTYANIFGMKISCGSSATGAFDETTGTQSTSFMQSCYFTSPARLTTGTVRCSVFDCTLENTKLSWGSALSSLRGCLYSCHIVALDGYGIEYIYGALSTVENCFIDCASYATYGVEGQILSTRMKAGGTCIYGRGTYIGCTLESGGTGYTVESGGADLRLIGCSIIHNGNTRASITLDGSTTTYIKNCVIDSGNYTTCWLKANSGSPTVRLSNNVCYGNPGSGVVTIPIDPTNITIINESPQLGGDADGDLYVRSGGALTRIAKGTALQDFRMNSGATLPGWENPYNNQVNYETLSGTKTIADGDPAIQILDPNGVDRDVNLPTTPVKSTRFTIKNNGDEYSCDFCLTIKVGGVEYNKLYASGVTEYCWTGTIWRAVSAGGGDIFANGSVNLIMGKNARIFRYGTALGGNAHATEFGTAIGYYATAQTEGVAIGVGASASQVNGRGVGIGTYAASTNYGAIALGYGSAATRTGEFSLDGNWNNGNKNKYSNLRWSKNNVAANSTNVELFLLGFSAYQFTLVANSTLGFELHFVGRDTVTANRGYYAIVKGAIQRDGSNATSLIGTTTIEEVTKTAGVTWTVDAIADDANDALVPVILTTDPTNITAWTVTGFITTVSA